jgi:FkbM family methyltransferase
MTIQELSNILVNFTNEHYAKKDLQWFFQLMHQLALKGRGIGTGGYRETSGEAATMVLVRDMLTQQYPEETLTVFDVGANTGQFLTELLKVFGTDKRRYFSFEPLAPAFAELQKKFGNQAGVTLINAGMSDAEEQRPLYSNTPTSELASVYPRRLDHFGIAMNMVGTVTLHTLDQFAAEQKIERIHFLKMDVEGHEYKCLQGAKRLLENKLINIIQFEIGGTNIDSRTFFQDFWYALGNYRIFRIIRDGLHPVERYSESDECFITQNFLAILKT